MTTVPDPTNPFKVAHGGGAPSPGSYGTVMLTALVRLHQALQEVRLPLDIPGVEEQRTNVILQFADATAARALGHDFRVDARVIVDEAKNAVRVPLGALFRHGDGWAVYRVVGGRAVLTALEAGIADGNYRVVVDGLEPGAQVILFPGSAVTEGQRVEARKPD